MCAGTQRGVDVRRTTAIALISALGTASLGLASVGATPAFAALGATSDFNCDGYSDLAVGVPGETVGTVATGIVEVFWGSDAGIQPDATVLRIGAAGAPGVGLDGDRFGAAVKSGHLDDDTCDDLAVGAPGADLGGTVDAGAVFVFYGSASGFTTNRTSKITRGSKGVPSNNQAGALFGAALATGDANGDFIDDLAIGAPSDDGTTTLNSGSVTVIYAPGETGGGTYNSNWFREGIGNVAGTPETNAAFGASLSFGNFAEVNDSDFSQELAVGAPGRNSDGARDSGAIFVLANNGGGLVGVGSVVLTQNSPGVPGSSELGDGFGYSLASGALLGNDEPDDLAVGVPNEDVGSRVNSGDVIVIGGSSQGLLGSGAPLAKTLYEGAGGVPDTAETGDKFGRSLVAANFSSDAVDVDLAIGVANEDLLDATDVGCVVVMRSSGGTLSGTNPQMLCQGSGSVPGTAEAGDLFGYAMAAGDFRGTGANDLAIGAPYEDGSGLMDSGAVTLLNTDGNRLDPAGSGAAVFVQDTSGVPDVTEARDRFGTL